MPLGQDLGENCWVRLLFILVCAVIRTQQESNQSKPNRRWAYTIAFVFPLFIATIVLFTSPNFRQTDSTETGGAFGGDYLQEWVGGRILLKHEFSQLYDQELSDQIQHDSALLGFDWKESDYYPMVYPPFYYLLVSPLSAVEYKTAARIWCLLMALGMSLTLILLIQSQPFAARHWIWLVPIATLFSPVLLAVNMGQKSAIALAIITATFILLQKDRKFAAGLVFGLMIFKPQLAIVIGLALLLKRELWFAAGSAITVSVAVLVSLWMGVDVCKQYLDVAKEFSNYLTTHGYQFAEAHSLWSSIQLCLANQSETAVKVVTALATLAVAFILQRILNGKNHGQVESKLRCDQPIFYLQYSALVIATVLLSPHFYTYDLAILLLPMILVLQYVSNLTNDFIGEQSKYCHRRVQPIIIVAVFVLSGLFSGLADWAGFQFSVVLFMFWLLTLWHLSGDRLLNWCRMYPSAHEKTVGDTDR